MGPYKTVAAAFNALKKGFKKQTKRDPNPIEEEMIMEEAKTKITSQGENISTLDTGIMSQASGTTGKGMFDNIFNKMQNEMKGLKAVDDDLPPPGSRGGKDDIAAPVMNVEDAPPGFIDFVRKTDPEGAAKLQKVEDEIKAAIEAGNKRADKKNIPFATEAEMSEFTLKDNARKLNKAKGMIDKLGAKTTEQKLFVADLVEDAGMGIFDTVDMGAVVRSNMFDDLIEQGIDEDVLMDVMYSGTKSDDFGITMAKIKSNAQDKGIDINETVDFYERSFEEISRPKKADGGLSNILGV